MIPNKNNLCGGNFDDCLDVFLTQDCDGKCFFCIEKDGWHPKNKLPPIELLDLILKDNRNKVSFLGGEPTLYRGFEYILRKCNENGKQIFLTTNGSLFSTYKDQYGNKYTYNGDWTCLKYLHSLRISIHHYDFSVNKSITGINIDGDCLLKAIDYLKKHLVNIRFNCCLIKGVIDSKLETLKYVNFAKLHGVNNIKFAELELVENKNNFVSLTDIFGYNYGLNDDPFCLGCCHQSIINDCNVTLAQVCKYEGRKIHTQDEVVNRVKVLYYDGNIYEGWQSEVEHSNMLCYFKPKKIGVKAL